MARGIQAFVSDRAIVDLALPKDWAITYAPLEDAHIVHPIDEPRPNWGQGHHLRIHERNPFDCELADYARVCMRSRYPDIGDPIAGQRLGCPSLTFTWPVSQRFDNCFVLSPGNTIVELMIADARDDERRTAELAAIEASLRWSQRLTPQTWGSLVLIGYWRPRPEWAEYASEIELSLPRAHDWIDPSWSAADRAMVLAHLRAGRETCMMLGLSPCRICGRENGSRELSDGVFVWPEGLAHYVRDHGLRLPNSFVRHCRFGRSLDLRPQTFEDWTWWLRTCQSFD